METKQEIKKSNKTFDFCRYRNINLLLSIDGQKSMSKLSRLKDTTQWYSNVQSMITLFEIEKLIKTEKQGRIKKTYLTGKGEKLKYNLNELKNEMIKLNIWK